MDATTTATPAAAPEAARGTATTDGAAAETGLSSASRRRLGWRALVVWGAWLWMVIGAWSYVGRYASRIPVWDDLDLVPLIQPDFHWTIKELWGLHNEHRIPLPRVIEGALYGATHDIRTPMFVEVGMLAALSLAAILVARRLRGRTALVDALFPLLWLHTGNHENLLMGFQISIVLPTALACTIIMVAISQRRRGFGPGAAATVGLCLVALPLFGGQGMVFAAVLAAGLVVAAFVSARQPERELRRGAAWLGVMLALTAFLGACYVIGFQYPEGSARTHDIWTVLSGGLRAASLVLGIAGQSWWPWSGILVTALLLATTALVVSAWRRRPDDRFRMGVIAFGLAAGACLALSIGFGRAGHGLDAAFAVRYIPFPSPLVLTAALAWILYGGRVARWLVPGAMVVAMLAANVFVNTPAGSDYGSAREGMAQELGQDVQSGMPPGPFIAKWTGRIHPHPARLFILTRMMAKMRLEPFDEIPEALREPYTWSMMNLPPVRLEGPHGAAQRWMNNVWPILMVHAGTALHFEVFEGVTRFVGSYGILDAAVDRGETHGVRLVISGAPADGDELEVLYDRTIDPVRRPRQRGGHGFDVALPAKYRHVVLEVRWPEGAPQGHDWAFLGDMTFQ